MPDNNKAPRQAKSNTYRSHNPYRYSRPSGKKTRNEQEAGTLKQKTKLLSQIPVILALMVVALSILYSLTLSTVPKVVVLDTGSKAFLQPLSTYQNQGEEQINSSIFNQLKLTINTSKIAGNIKNNHPELSGVTVVVPLISRQPIIEIQPAIAAFISVTPHGRYVVSDNGVAFYKLKNNQSYQYQLIIDNRSVGYNLGVQVLSQDETSFITGVIGQFNSKNIKIQTLVLSQTPYELDITPVGAGYYIKFNLLGNSRLEAGAYFASLKLMKTTNRPLPSQYFDVRVDGRVFYK